MEAGQLILWCKTENVVFWLEDNTFLYKCLKEELVRQDFQLVTLQQVEDNPDLRLRVEASVGFYHSTPRLNKLLPSLPKLRTVSFPSAGIGTLDVQQCKQAKISIGNVSAALSDIVADFAMTLILSAARRLIPGIKVAHSGKMGCKLPDYGFHVTGSTMGIVGMGAVGYEIAKRGHRGFDMQIRYYNRTRRSTEDEAYVGAVYSPSLHEMLPGCDVVLLSCPLTADTRGMMGYKEFSIMKDTALLVNMGRGPLVNQEELVRALQTGQIGQAALDVTDPEPLPEGHPLLHLNNVLITPHMAWHTQCMYKKLTDLVIENMKRGLQNKKLVCGIDVA